MKKLFLVYLIALSNLLWADEETLIEDPTLVSQLNLIQINLDKVSSTIMNCMDTGKEHPACMCQSRDIIIQFNNSVNLLIQNNKAIENLDLVRFKSTDGIWVTQSLNGLLTQANAEEPSCT